MIFSNQKFINNNRKNVYLYLGISLLFALYYGAFFYYYAFTHEYIIQDDGRHHIVWLQKFVDAELFPQDYIANYFLSLAPIGYKALYFVAAKIGIEPLLLAKILPPILGLITTVYIYFFTLEILPLPITGCISSLLINQLMWLNDDLVTATPRAFLYPLFAAFLYYLSQRKIIPCLILMLLQGLFYPQILLIQIAIVGLGLLRYDKFLFKLTQDKKAYIWFISGLIASAIALIPLTQKKPELATVITAKVMEQMPEFNQGGRTPFYGGGWFDYWLINSNGLNLPLFPTIVWLGVGLPFLMRTRLPIIKLITPKIIISLQVTVASLILFIAAHILLPTLHLPGRYTYHTLRFILGISSAIVITLLLNLALNWYNKKIKYHSFKPLDKLKITLVLLFSLTVIIFPAVPYVFVNWFQNWRIGTETEIYQYLAQQPKDILVASLSEEINNIPAFSQRSILTGREFAYAYHPVYYNQIKQRTINLLQAQYSPDIAVLKSFVKQYDVDYLLIENTAFTPEYLLEKDWLINSSFSSETRGAIISLNSNSSALTQLILPCSVVTTKNFNLLDTACILKVKSNN